jgi:23S rRNA pseudouridine2605 synthase
MANFRKFGKSDNNASNSRSDSNSKDSSRNSSDRNPDSNSGRGYSRGNSSDSRPGSVGGGSDRNSRPSSDRGGYSGRGGSDKSRDSKPSSDRGLSNRGGSDRNRDERARSDRGPANRGGSDRNRDERARGDRGPANRGESDRNRDSRPSGDRGFSGRGSSRDERPGSDRGFSGRGGSRDERPSGDSGFSGRGGSDRNRGERPGSDRGFSSRGGSVRNRDERPGSDRGFSGRGGSDRNRDERPSRDGGFSGRAGSRDERTSGDRERGKSENTRQNPEERYFRRAPLDKGKTEKSGFQKEERPRKGRPALKNFKPNNDHQVGPERAPRYDPAALKSKASPRVQEKIDENPVVQNEEIRLNKYISNSGLCSRREADDLIESGMIKVNGEVVTEMGYKVKDSDTVKYGKDVLNRERMMYVLLNKPKDFLTTMDDPQERKTVMDLVSGACKERVYPVGRLDRNTTGLLLLTNDGELTVKLTHPSNDIKKIYQAELDKPITEEHFEMIKEGLELEDGLIKPDQLAITSADAHVVGIEIHSGKNRIVRRIFEHLGYEVTKLDRTTYAGLTKKDLPRGKWRFLSEKELIRLKYML